LLTTLIYKDAAATDLPGERSLSSAVSPLMRGTLQFAGAEGQLTGQCWCCQRRQCWLPANGRSRANDDEGETRVRAAICQVDAGRGGKFCARELDAIYSRFQEALFHFSGG